MCVDVVLCALCTAYYLPQNAGDIARKYIKDPQLLSFIDAEVSKKNVLWFKLTVYFTQFCKQAYFFFLQCFIVSTVNALQTPMINASMVGFLFFGIFVSTPCFPFLFSS